MVYPIQNVEKQGVEACLEDQAQQVGPPQATSLLARVAVQVGALVQHGVLQVLLLTQLHVGDHHEGRAGDEDQLQGPQADVGDGEDAVIAHVGTARLQGGQGVGAELTVSTQRPGCFH